MYMNQHASDYLHALICVSIIHLYRITYSHTRSTHTKSLNLNDLFPFPPSVDTHLSPVLRFGGVVYLCRGRFPACVSLFPASGLFSLCPAAPPFSPAPLPSPPSSRACQHQLHAQDQPTFLGRQTFRLPLALLKCCCPSGCEEMGQCLTAEEGDSGWNMVYSVGFPVKVLIVTVSAVQVVLINFMAKFIRFHCNNSKCLFFPSRAQSLQGC